MSVSYEDTIQWLIQKKNEANQVHLEYVQKERDIIDYIQEILWRYEDMRILFNA